MRQTKLGDRMKSFEKVFDSVLPKGFDGLKFNSVCFEEID